MKNILNTIQKTNEQAFKDIFSSYYSGLCAYASQFIDFEEAQEIVQDVMVWLWENNDVFIAESSLKGYLFKMVKNRCITLINRNELKRRVLCNIHEKMKHVYEDPDFYIVEELSQRIEKALSNLPETYREAFELNRFKDMTYKEIADQLQISPKTVDYRICQALKLLREDLKDYSWLLFFISDFYFLNLLFSANTYIVR